MRTPININVNVGRFQPYLLEPGAPGAYSCFGSWENVRTCQPIHEVTDPLDGCSQAFECRKYTLEQNPPTTRFRVKPRRDGRFEVQQFRDFIREETSYHMDIQLGTITITYPGKRNVPKSKRFFLHVKHLEEAKLDVDAEFELVMSMESMVLRQAGDEPLPTAALIQRHQEEDPEARRRRIGERLRQKASRDAMASDLIPDLDIELDIDIDVDVDDLELDEGDAADALDVEKDTPALPEDAGADAADAAESEGEDDGPSDDAVELEIDGLDTGKDAADEDGDDEDKA